MHFSFSIPLFLTLVLTAGARYAFSEIVIEPPAEESTELPDNLKKEPREETPSLPVEIIEQKEGKGSLFDFLTKKPALEVVGSETNPQGSEGASSAEGALVRVGARVDAAFSAGGPVEQGFHLPSVRLWTSGMLASKVGYRFAVGPTREFSTVMLSQIVPVEAYALLGNEPDLPSGTYLRVGMFRPKISPFWSPDLAVLPFPDYLATHKAVFFGNDIGVEVGFSPLGSPLEITIGAMNGTGIFALNTNNTKAVTTQAKASLSLPRGKFHFGLGAGRLMQSAEGSVSFKNQWFATLFGFLESERLQMGIDATLGEYLDSLVSLRPTGASAWLSVRPLNGLKFLLVAENLGPTPEQGTILFHSQVGPVLELDKSFQIFLYYDTKTSTGVNGSEREDTAQVRVRAAL